MAKNEPCELFRLIPKEEINRVFRDSETASAEMDYTFMGFENVYKSVLNFVPQGKVIIDLGCSYAAQSYYFTEYRGYIGVDRASLDHIFKTRNSKFYRMTIQDFCRKVIDKKWDLDKVFAVCSYVPDDEARRMVRETFPHCLVYYPA